MRAGDLVQLGRTPLRVSRLGLGLASLGGLFSPVPAAQAAAVLDRAWDLGIRLYDTAPSTATGAPRPAPALRSRPGRATRSCCAPRWGG